MAFCLFSQNKLSGIGNQDSLWEGDSFICQSSQDLLGMRGEREEVRIAGEVVFTYVFYDPKTSFSLLAVSSCVRYPGQSMTSCPWGCSTMVSDTSTTPGAECLKREGT